MPDVATTVVDISRNDLQVVLTDRLRFGAVAASQQECGGKAAGSGSGENNGTGHDDECPSHGATSSLLAYSICAQFHDIRDEWLCRDASASFVGQLHS